jgi:hypothetical protein
MKENKKKKALKTSGFLPEQTEGMDRKWKQFFLENLNRRDSHVTGMCMQWMTVNITDTAQLIIFTCGTDTAFHGYKKHARLCSLIRMKTGNELVLKAEDLILWYWAQKNRQQMAAEICTTLSMV